MEKDRVYITECPRDAIQGIQEFIATEKKINYLNELLQVGFDVIDFGSFVSEKAIPQLKDTHQVVQALHWQQSNSQLLAIVANVRGAEEALQYEAIKIIGFPLSVSEQFQQRNTHKSIAAALETVKILQEKCVQTRKTLQVYLSMAFGNPYQEVYNPTIVNELVARLADLGVQRIALSDTIGIATPQSITDLFSVITQKYPNLIISAHLHSNPATATEKIAAAYYAGCRYFESALGGLGGCPMATDHLTGNIATETLLQWFATQQISHQVNEKKLYAIERIVSNQ